MDATQTGRAVALAELLRLGWSPKAVSIAAQMLDEGRSVADILAEMRLAETDRSKPA